MKTVYSVGEVAALLNYSAQMLRKYEKMGLLTPSRGDNNYRFYESPDITMLIRIRLLRNMGFSLEEIARIVSPQRRSEVPGLFEDRISRMEEEIRRLELMISCARMHEDYYKEYEQRRDEIRIETIPGMRYILYREGRVVRPEILKEKLLAKIMADTPPFQYMIRLPGRRDLIQQGNYEVGMAIPADFSADIPPYEGEQFIEEKTCATVFVRHEVEKKEMLWENLPLDEEFEKSGIYRFMEENELETDGDIFGLTYFDEKEKDTFTHYIKYHFPVRKKELQQ